jgi:hypothetical protein
MNAKNQHNFFLKQLLILLFESRSCHFLQGASFRQLSAGLHASDQFSTQPLLSLLQCIDHHAVRWIYQLFAQRNTWAKQAIIVPVPNLLHPLPQFLPPAW